MDTRRSTSRALALAASLAAAACGDATNGGTRDATSPASDATVDAPSPPLDAPTPPLDGAPIADGGLDVPTPPPDAPRPPPDASPPADAPPPPADGGIGPTGGAVDRLHFAVFGDVRPPFIEATTQYPTAIIDSVMDGLTAQGAQFAVSGGDYMFAYDATAANAQLDLFQAAERRFAGHVFHGMGNHECTSGESSNCPLGTESANVRAFRTRLVADQPDVYYDFVVRTSMGPAHFLITAPNAWSAAQQTWLDRAIAQPATYTFVVAHEPPTSGGTFPPGSSFIEDAIRTRAGGVTLRLYGHTHEYRRIATNALIAGNAGAPLQTGASYGFVMVDQRADGAMVVTAYDIGSPPMVVDTWAVHADGTSAR